MSLIIYLLPVDQWRNCTMKRMRARVHVDWTNGELPEHPSVPFSGRHSYLFSPRL